MYAAGGPSPRGTNHQVGQVVIVQLAESEDPAEGAVRLRRRQPQFRLRTGEGERGVIADKSGFPAYKYYVCSMWCISKLLFRLGIASFFRFSSTVLTESYKIRQKWRHNKKFENAYFYVQNLFQYQKRWTRNSMYEKKVGQGNIWELMKMCEWNINFS